MLSVVMLSVTMLSVIMLSVGRPSVNITKCFFCNFKMSTNQSAMFQSGRQRLRFYARPNRPRKRSLSLD